MGEDTTRRAAHGPTEDGERVPVPRLTSRSATAWGLGTVGLVLASMAFLALTQPSYAVEAGVAVLVVVLVLVVLVTRRQWLEPERGRIVVSRLGRVSRAVDLQGARSVRLVDNRGGGLSLTVAPASGRAMLVPVLLLSDYVRRSQASRVLRLLADQLERYSPDVAGRVPAQLRRQADHVDSGGSAAHSPLAALTSNSVMRAAKAGGAASTTSLFD